MNRHCVVNKSDSVKSRTHSSTVLLPMAVPFTLHQAPDPDLFTFGDYTSDARTQIIANVSAGLSGPLWTGALGAIT